VTPGVAALDFTLGASTSRTLMYIRSRFWNSELRLRAQGSAILHMRVSRSEMRLKPLREKDVRGTKRVTRDA